MSEQMRKQGRAEIRVRRLASEELSQVKELGAPGVQAPLLIQGVSGVLRLQRAIGNSAVTRLVQRAIDAGKVDATKQSLDIKSQIRAVEAPKKAKATSPISTYPNSSKLNLPDSITNKSMAKLNFPDQTDKEQAEMWGEATAFDIVQDMLGGGAYNHSEDLVVLAEGFSDPALLHEMGHKKQNESGFNAGSVSVVLLEYYNFLANENKPWLEKGTGKPRLAYDEGAAKKKPTKSWAELKEHVTGTLHHTSQSLAMLEQIETLLTGEKYKDLAAQIKNNLISEYFQKAT